MSYLKLKLCLLFGLLVLLCCNTSAKPYSGSSFLTYIQTDRNCFVSGDFILFKAYHVNANKEFSKSEIALYVDIATKDSVFISGEIVKLESGAASGIIELPDSLKTGEYLLRVYSSYSKQYQNKGVLFSKIIYVTNRFGNNSNKTVDNNSNINFKTFIDSSGEIESDKIHIEFDTQNLKKRSKVQARIYHGDNTGFNGSLSVKPLSQYEKYYASLSDNISGCHVKPANNKSTSKVLAVEEKGFVIAGRAVNALTQEPLANAVVFIAADGSELNFRTAVTDSSGDFCLLFNPFYGNKKVYVSCYKHKNLEYLPNAEVYFESKFLKNTNDSSAEVLADEYEKSFDTLNLQKAIVNRAYKIKFIEESLDTVAQNKSFEELYFINHYNYSINLDEYVEFNDFLDISREVLPFFKIRQNKDGYKYAIVDPSNNIIRDNPIVIVDGVPLPKIDDLVSWGSDKIDRIDLKAEPHFYGDIAFLNGIVFVWTKENNFWTDMDIDEVQAHVLQGFQLAAKFEFPTYNTNKKSLIPDFRQTLYWNNSIEIEAGANFDLQFYTSDEKGWFEVIVEGITSNNSPVYIRKLIYIE